jgi:hypothetical protein
MKWRGMQVSSVKKWTKPFAAAAPEGNKKMDVDDDDTTAYNSFLQFLCFLVRERYFPFSPIL